MNATATPSDRLHPVARPDGPELGLSLRPATEEDIPFFKTLYRSFRAEEMAPVPWTEAAKDAFLEDQFRLQHHHFVTHYGDGDFLVVEHEGAPVGRLYLHGDEAGLLVVDIGFLPAVRGRGLGQALLAWVLRRAAERGAPKVWLHVLAHNLPARRLYERMGFVVVDEESAHLRMERPIL